MGATLTSQTLVESGDFLSCARTRQLLAVLPRADNSPERKSCENSNPYKQRDPLWKRAVALGSRGFYRLLAKAHSQQLLEFLIGIATLQCLLPVPQPLDSPEVNR